MSETKFKITKEVELDEPILIEGLPGIGYVGKLAADHLVEEFDAEKFAEMTSPYFPHHVTVDEDGVMDLVKIDFYHTAIDGQDLIILVGEVQATSSEGHYEVSNKLLDIAEDRGVTEIFALGGYATGKHSSSKPKVVGASNDDDLLQEFRDKGIDVEEGTGPILGVSGLLLGLGKGRGIKGSALLGETHGILVDPGSAKAVLEALATMLDFEIDVSKLEERAEKTEEIISRLRREQKLREVSEAPDEEEDLSYIG